MKYQLINKVKIQYSPIQQILTNRGIALDLLPLYLNTTDDVINSPLLLNENLLREAAIILIQTIQHNHSVLVIVDSDCDGFTSSAILINYLHDIFPAWVEQKLQYVVHKGKEHGLNDHIDNIIQSNIYKLIIVPDAGTNDTDSCKKLYDKGISTIILDHHLKEQENSYAIIINNQICNYPNKELSGAGVTWQFCRYLDKLLNVNYASRYIDLVALGLCADMMSMIEIETKHLVNKGFANVTNPFFYSLAQKNDFSMKGKINHTNVAFYIAPYVNATCRSGTKEEKLLVFESMLYHKAFQQLPSTKRGHYLGETEQLIDQAIRTAINVKSRQTKAQDQGMKKLEQKIHDKHLLNHKVLLFLLQPGEIDKNIAGLIANKIMAKYQRPVCVLTRAENDVIKAIEVLQDKSINFFVKTSVVYEGSARGCDLIGLNDFKSVCAKTGLVNWTIGHPGAFGTSIDEEKIQDFISNTDSALKDISNEPIYYVDYIYQGSDFNPQDILTIANMQDLWGKDIPQSLIAIEHLKITPDMVTVYVKKDNTLKINLPNGVNIMKFKATDEECFKLQNTHGYYELNIIGKCRENEWGGNITGQIFIQNYEIIDAHEWYF